MSAVPERSLLQDTSADAQLHGNLDFAMLSCPNVRDPKDGFIKPDPNCDFPPRRLARGSADVDAFMNEFQVQSGDLIAATFDIRNQSSSTTVASGGRHLLVGDAADEGADGLNFALRRESIRVVTRADRSKEVYTGTTIELRTVVYLLDLCGWLVPWRSPENYYQTCSYGKTTFRPENVVILAANDPKLRDILQTPTNRRAMIILPREVKCTFAGVADISCSTPLCSSYIKHNHGLPHAARGAEEYGDETDPMGTSQSGQAVMCHNAAFNYRIGWATAVPGGDLDTGSFTPFQNRRSFNIPASSQSDQHMVIVQMSGISIPDVSSGRSFKYYISYRVTNSTYGGYDTALPSQYDRRVLLHTYSGGISERSLSVSTFLSTAGPRFSSDFADPAFPNRNVFTAPFIPYDARTNMGGGLRIKVVSVGGMSATVEVCRMYARTEGTPDSPECQANLDRDCSDTGVAQAAAPDSANAAVSITTAASAVPTFAIKEAAAITCSETTKATPAAANDYCRK
ncbi:hypothetical protein PLESTF_000461800 [Pleodorina starrii]|nr:hypothetical protein PLESTF_000461800 [Pleodorina starrii]